MQRKTLGHLVGLLACLTVIACGDKEAAQVGAPQTPAATQQPATTTPPAAPAVPEPVVTVTPDANGVVHLTANDQMRYSATRIEAKAGQTLKVELKNLGTLPKAAMGHNFVLLQPGSDAAAYAAKAATAQAADYLPAGASEVLAHTKLLGPGEVDTIELPALSAGTAYPFLCSFPGHFVFMKGVLVVQ